MRFENSAQVMSEKVKSSTAQLDLLQGQQAVEQSTDSEITEI